MDEKIEYFDDNELTLSKYNVPTLAQFAFLGVSKVYYEKLALLAELAEKEIWTCGEREYEMLSWYLSLTFQKCYEQNKVIYSQDEEYCAFNTGLVTPSQEDIIGLFSKNRQTDAQKWFFISYVQKSSREIMSRIGQCPPLASFTRDFREFNFNGYINIQCDVGHILEDNWQRIETEVGMNNRELGKMIFDGAMRDFETRILRNVRLAIPQYYKGRIMFLLPISFPLFNGEKITMPLAVQEVKTKQYRANTLLTIEMAYIRGRILMKLDGTWLERELIAKHNRILSASREKE